MRTLVRDSAGVQIVENLGDLFRTEPLWRVGAAPEAHIGSVDGDEAYLFDNVSGVVVLGDRRIVVANAGDRTLRWYDADGGFLFRRGGQGDGPGEFSYLGSISRTAGDSVVALDWSTQRFTLFGPDGGVGRSGTINGLRTPPARMYPLSDGSWIVGAAVGFSTAGIDGRLDFGVHRLTAPILRVAPEGSRADTVGVFPASEVEVKERSIGTAPLGRNLHYAVARDGVLVGTAERFEIDVYSVEGRLLRSVRAPGVDTDFTPEMQAAYRDRRRAGLVDAAVRDRASAERSIAEMNLPERLPAYASLLIDDADNLWVGQYRLDPTSPRRYLVFGPEGRFVTVVELPASFTPLSIDDGRVWGRETDDLGVQYVASYGMVQP